MGAAKTRRASTLVNRKTSTVVLSLVVALRFSPVSCDAAESGWETKTRAGTKTKTHDIPPPSAPDYPPHPPLVPGAPEYPPWPEYPPTPEHPGYPQYPHPPHAPSPPPRPPPAPWPPWPPHAPRGPPPPRSPPSPKHPTRPPAPPPPPPEPTSASLTALFVAACAASVFFGARLAFFDERRGESLFREFVLRRKMRWFGSLVSGNVRDEENAYVALAGSGGGGSGGDGRGRLIPTRRGSDISSGSLDDFADLRDLDDATPIETPRVYEDDYADAESSDAESARSGDVSGVRLTREDAAAAAKRKRKEGASRGSNREPPSLRGDGAADESARVPRLVTRTVPASAREWRDDVVGSL